MEALLPGGLKYPLGGDVLTTEADGVTVPFQRIAVAAIKDAPLGAYQGKECEMKQDQFQAEVLARFELLDKRLHQIDKAVRDLQSHVDKGHNEVQDQIVDLATAFARAGIHLEEKT